MHSIRRLLFISGITCLVIFFGCQKSDPNKSVAVQFSTDSIQLIIGAQVNSIDSFKIFSEFDWNLTVTPAVPWLKLNVSNGNGNQKVIASSLETNNTGAPRTATITITPVNSSARPITIIVTQKSIGLTISSISPDHGPACVKDTVRGLGFSKTAALNTVLINGNAANVISASDTMLVVIIPYKAGTGIVTVKVGDVTASGPKFTYEPSTFVSTFAGTGGGPGFLDGTGTNAQFSYPSGIVKDATGNLYVTDNYNRSIRKITPSGVVTTLATFSNIMSSPIGIDIDAFGNLYVADNVVNVIYKVTPGGVVSFFVNVGPLDSPIDVTVNTDGNIYILESGNRRILKIPQQGGIVSTFAGNGIITSFNAARGIKSDKDGNLYVTESESIRKITLLGTVSTIAGSTSGLYEDGPVSSTRFYQLQNVAFDSNGIMYIADRTRIRKITPNGMIRTIAGDGSFGFADAPGYCAQFSQATALVFDANGNLFVADNGNTRIRKIVFE